jgi:predicted phosphodiesterase
MTTLIVGDIHGEWKELNILINRKKPNNIIQLGDWGWFPHYHNKKGILPKNKIFNQFGIKNIQQNHKTNIYWIRGNHDNVDDLWCLTENKPYEIQDGIIYCPFGTILNINDKNILCCGGGESIDKDMRIEGDSWWRKETIQLYEFDNLPDCKIDIVISHTIPLSFFNYFDKSFNSKLNDPSTKALENILNNYKPKEWYSGHFHHYICKDVKTTYGTCKWTSLSYPKSTEKWWCVLEK